MKLDTGIVTKGGKHIYTGDIVRPAKRSNHFASHELGKKWIVRLPPYPFVLVDVETGKAYDNLRRDYSGELVIVGQEDVNDVFLNLSPSSATSSAEKLPTISCAISTKKLPRNFLKRTTGLSVKVPLYPRQRNCSTL